MLKAQIRELVEDVARKYGAEVTFFDDSNAINCSFPKGHLRHGDWSCTSVRESLWTNAKQIIEFVSRPTYPHTILNYPKSDNHSLFWNSFDGMDVEERNAYAKAYHLSGNVYPVQRGW